MSSRITTIPEKLFPSLVNIAIVLTIALPYALLEGFGLGWELLCIASFFLYNLGFALFNNNRCLGMMLTKTYWQKDFTVFQKLLYTTLYTLSFATIFVWLWLPFDILVANLLLLQLPLVLTKSTTLHGYLSGDNRTIKHE